MGRRQHFDEHVHSRLEGDLVVPRSRFVGMTGLVGELGASIPAHLQGRNGVPELSEIAFDVDDAFQQSSRRLSAQQFPINSLRAVHHINREHVRDLFGSIKSQGFDDNEPVSVVETDDGHGVLLDGHHRTVAARAAGMTTIPAIVVPASRLRRNLSEDYFTE